MAGYKPVRVTSVGKLESAASGDFKTAHVAASRQMVGDKVKDYLAAIKTYEGASGNLVSDGKRGFIKPFVEKIIKNGIPENYNP